MPYWFFHVVALSLTLAFVGTLPQRHLWVEPVPFYGPAISAPNTRDVDVWYKPASRLNLRELPCWPLQAHGSHADRFVKPAWGVFAGIAACCMVLLFERSNAINNLLFCLSIRCIPLLAVILAMLFLWTLGGKPVRKLIVWSR